jgi:transcriptional regulator with XRE-family HTH domain
MSDKSKNDIGENLADLRKSKKFTQEEIAKELGIPRSGVSLLEHGKRGIKIEELQKYKELLKTKLEKLMEPVKAKDGDKEETAVSENRTVTAGVQRFFPMVSEVTADLGLDADSCNVEYHKVLSTSNTVCKASVTFHMNLNEATARQGMIDAIDEISALYPAAKPALEIDAGDMVGTHVLSFLVLGEEVPAQMSARK